MKVAVINAFGFESGGMTTLCFYYNKLGIDVYIKDIVRPLKYKTLPAGAFVYSKDDELLDIAKCYERLIFLPPAYKSDYKTGKYEKAFYPIFKIKKYYPDIQLCYLYCSRGADDFVQYLLPTLENNQFEFDYYFSISTELIGIKDNIVAFDINAFMFTDSLPVDFESKENVILTAGRVEGFKGVVKYLGSLVPDNKFIYVHEGAGYSFNKTGVSVPPQLLSMKKDPRFSFKDYTESPTLDTINIYPTYKLDDIYNRWPKYFAGVCCIMGTNHKYTKTIDLLGNVRWSVTNSAEDTLIKKQSNLWGICGLEYANLEMINLGLPVLFSRGYSILLGFNDDRLIYDNFSEIPDKLYAITNENTYIDCVQYQRQFFEKKQAAINKCILEIFNKEKL